MMGVSVVPAVFADANETENSFADGLPGSYVTPEPKASTQYPAVPVDGLNKVTVGAARIATGNCHRPANAADVENVPVFPIKFPGPPTLLPGFVPKEKVLA